MAHALLVSIKVIFSERIHFVTWFSANELFFNLTIDVKCPKCLNRNPNK